MMKAFKSAGALLLCMLTLAGCGSGSPFKTEASKANDIAKSALSAVQGGNITYGDFDRIQKQIASESAALDGVAQSTDPSEKASEDLFKSSWMAFSSSYDLLGTTKFLDEKLHDLTTGGISPAFSATVGSNDIASIQSDVSHLSDCYGKLH